MYIHILSSVFIIYHDLFVFFAPKNSSALSDRNNQYHIIKHNIYKLSNERKVIMLEMDYIIAPKIPQGLAPAVEGLAREILRRRPRNIYTFAAHHFEKLVQLRDKERAAGTNSGRVNSKSLNKRDRIFNWIGINNNDFEGPKDCIHHPSTSKCIRDPTAVRKEHVTSITRKLPKKKRDTTSASGWSINETSKVLRKHKNLNDHEVENHWDTKVNEKRVNQKPPIQSQRSSPRSSDKKIHPHLFRSFSVGSVLVDKNLKYQSPECEKKFYRSAEVNKRDVKNVEEHRTSYKYSKLLNRQESIDQLDSFWSQLVAAEEGPYLVGRKRSRSLVNESGSSRNGLLFGNEDIGTRLQHVAGDRIIRNSRDQWVSVVEDKEEEEGKVEELQSTEDIVGKSRHERRNTEEIEKSSVDSVQDNIFSDAVNSSVVLPSVVTRQSSGKSTRNGGQKSNHEQNVSDKLTLPPIGNETSKQNKKEDHLALPAVLATETLESNVTEIHDSNQECLNWEQIVSFEDTDKVECPDSVYAENIILEKNEELQIEEEEDHGHNETELSKELSSIRNASPGNDSEESFKDSLNVTPDLTNIPQRPDSLELDFERRSDQPIILSSREEQEEAEKLDRYPSNELKMKLIEIETVERNIESTLVSSQAEAKCTERFEEPMESSATVLISEESNNACENEATPLIREEELEDSKEDNLSDGNIKNKEENTDDSVKIEKEIAKHSPNRLEDSSTSSTDIQQLKDQETFDESRKPVDPSCYILTEGSPCEIPETVTTVIIPDEEYHISIISDDSSCQKDGDPFGEHVSSEVFQSPTIDAQFLRNIKIATDRMSIHQDLENIKEEEENDSIPVNAEQSHVALHSSVEESVEDIIIVDQKGVQVNLNSQGDLEEEEPKVSNNHSCDGSSSLNDATPYVPELNLDSLQDTTISSFERSDSKALERNLETENGSVTPCNGDNITSSSEDTLASEKDVVTLSLENESPREQQLLSNHEDSKSESELGSGKLCSVQDQGGKEIVDKFAYNKIEESSRSLEEEIAKELIENLIKDVSALKEQTLTKEEEEEKEEKSRGEEEEIEAEPLNGPIEADSNNEEKCEHIEEYKKFIPSLRHTGEFHDSLPLTIVEIPNNIPTTNVSELKGTDPEINPCLPSHTNFYGNQGSPIVPNIVFPNLSDAFPHMIVLSTNSQSFHNKPTLIEWLLKAAPTIVRTEQPFSEVHSERPTASVAEEIYDTSIDNVCEPLLTLDNTRQSVIIEEILDTDTDKDKRKNGSSSICGTAQSSSNEDSLINMLSDSFVSDHIDQTIEGKGGNEPEGAEEQTDKNDK